MTIAKGYPYCRLVIGRSLIRTFMTGAAKNAAIVLEVMSKLYYI